MKRCCLRWLCRLMGHVFASLLWLTSQLQLYLFLIIGKLKAYLEMDIRRSYSTSKVMLKFTTNYGTVIVVGGEGL